MPIPQVTDRIKEAPAVALRAVFAGIGQLLMAVDKIRAQMQEQATSSAAPGQRSSTRSAARASWPAALSWETAKKVCKPANGPL